MDPCLNQLFQVLADGDVPDDLCCFLTMMPVHLLPSCRQDGFGNPYCVSITTQIIYFMTSIQYIHFKCLAN